MSVETDVQVIAMIEVSKPSRESDRPERMPELVRAQGACDLSEIENKCLSATVGGANGLTVDKEDVCGGAAVMKGDVARTGVLAMARLEDGDADCVLLGHPCE